MLQPRVLARSLPLRVQSLVPLRQSYATATTTATATATATGTGTGAASGDANLADATASAFEAPPALRSDSPHMRTYKPRTPGVRHLRRPINDHLWKGRPYLALTLARKGQHLGGRNRTGRVTVRHRGGGAKRRYRLVDFERWDAGEHTVERVEYDPNRSAHIALVSHHESGKKSYILAAEGMRAGDKVQSYRRGLPSDLIKSMGGQIDPAIIAAKTAWRGNCLPLRMVPPGTYIYNIGLWRGKGGVLCRSAGTFAQVVGGQETVKRGLYVHVRLQSGEVRKIHREACATIGVASNGNHNRRQLGKAGRSRWLGIRPTVRGVAMNANEHPHGGGRGKSKGNVQPVSIWGRTLAKGGYKTRSKSKSNEHVVVPRPRNQGRRKKATSD